MTFGIERMLNACDSSGFSSELTLTSLTRPPKASATLSSVGPSARHGPHQGAQKSTTTGTVFEASMTSRSKVAVVTSMRDIVLHALRRSSRDVAVATSFWQATHMALPDRTSLESRSRVVAFGVAAVAVLGATVVWSAFGTRGVARPTARAAGARARRLRADRSGDGLDAALRHRVSRRSRTRPASARIASQRSSAGSNAATRSSTTTASAAISTRCSRRSRSIPRRKRSSTRRRACRAGSSARERRARSTSTTTSTSAT